MTTLHNTAWRLLHEKKLTIGYFGGSITEGSGASSPDKCYRSGVTAWFRETYPEAEILEIQAAIGGTGTDLGMYRCDRDLLAYKPDLVFFEYAVNDSYMDYHAVCAQTETIFRKIRRACPTAEIVTIFTTKIDVLDLLAAGGEYRSRTAQAAVSRHFGIPSVDVGEVLRTKVLLEGGDILRYTTDGCHPNDAGYALYTACITGWLADNLNVGEGELRTYPIPALFSEKAHDEARLEDCTALADLEIQGFTLTKTSLCGRYPHYLEGKCPGDSLSFSFTGENVGFYWMLAKDSGNVTVTIDSGEPRTFSSWDHYCKSFNRAGACFVGRDLPFGKHTVQVTIAAEKPKESEGTAVRIGAVLVS